MMIYLDTDLNYSGDMLLSGFGYKKSNFRLGNTDIYIHNGIKKNGWDEYMIFKDGEMIIYHSPNHYVEYDKGKKHGTEKVKNSSGIEYRFYINGLPDGQWKYTNYHDVTYRYEIYDNGVLVCTKGKTKKRYLSYHRYKNSSGRELWDDYMGKRYRITDIVCEHCENYN